MKLIKLEIQKDSCSGELLGHLKGEIFHLRSCKNYEMIISENFIHSNQDSRYIQSPSSRNSFGGNRGYVCLINLVNQSNMDINNGIDLYDFTAPSWLKDVHESHNEYCVCYFVLDRKIYDKIIPNEAGRLQHEKTGENYIPNLEVWYPTAICLNDIFKVLMVKIIEVFDNNNAFGRCMELSSKKMQ